MPLKVNDNACISRAMAWHAAFSRVEAAFIKDNTLIKVESKAAAFGRASYARRSVESRDPEC